MNGSTEGLTPQQLSDRAVIVDLTRRMAEHVDLLQWDRLDSCFTDDLTVNCSHVLGVDRGHVETSAAEFAEAWRRTVGGFEATQHFIANHRVRVAEEGSAATCAAYVQAHHYYANGAGDPLWTFGGHYDFDLVRAAGTAEHEISGWLINGFMTTYLWEAGNRYLLEQAAERTPTRPDRQ